jgi:hypothetical protein
VRIEPTLGIYPLLSRSTLLVHVVKKIEWDALSSLHSGWLINHPCPNEVDTTSFMLSLFFLTSSSMLSLSVQSISLSRGRGISTGKGMLLRIISATLIDSCACQRMGLI